MKNQVLSISQSLKIIEKWRYRYRIDTAFSDFIYAWAHAQSQLYPPQKALTSEFEEVAKELSFELQQLMFAGYDDPIGDILGELQLKKEKGFFPTPPDVSELMARLIGAPKQPTTFLDCCSGTGSLMMKQIEQAVLANCHLKRPLEDHEFYAEELDPLNCAACMIQVTHKLQYLSSLYPDKIIEPRRIQISNINVLSRELGHQHYLFVPKISV